MAESIKVDLAWEAELERLLKAHEQDDAALAALLEHASVQALPPSGDSTKRLFRLRHLADTNEVFEPVATEDADDVQTVCTFPFAICRC